MILQRELAVIGSSCRVLCHDACVIAEIKDSLQENMVAEADSLVKAAFGPTMLKAIGKTYVSQAEIFLGNFFEGSIAALKSKSSSMKSQMHALGLAIQVRRLTWRLQSSERKKAGNADLQTLMVMLSGIGHLRALRIALKMLCGQ